MSVGAHGGGTWENAGEITDSKWENDRDMGNIRENGGKITNSIDFTDKNREALELEVGKSNFEIFGED